VENFVSNTFCQRERHLTPWDPASGKASADSSLSLAPLREIFF